MKETSHIHCSFQAIFANKVIEQISVRFLDLGSPTAVHVVDNLYTLSTLIKMLTKIQDCKLEIPISCYILSIFLVFLLRSHFFYLIWTHILIYILV